MRVDLSWFIRELSDAGMLAVDDVNVITSTPRGAEKAQWHALQVIAEFGFKAMNDPSKLLDLDCLMAWFAEFSEQPLFVIDPLKINVTAITEVMSYAFAERHQILALEVFSDYIVIGSAQPFHTDWEQDLRHTLKEKDIRRVLISPADFHRYSIEFYNLAKSVSGASAKGGQQSTANFEQLLEIGHLKSPDANDQHIVNIVDWLLQYAFDQRASDIHLEPRRDTGNVRFRIDGVLHDVYEFPAAVMTAVSSRIKILGRMDVAEKRRPQDGRIKTKMDGGHEVELRLSTLPTAFGEKLVMRIFDPEVLMRSTKDMGLANEDYRRWKSLIDNPNGIVLVTGPTGSGKTTTLYSTLKQLATPEVNVCSVEDPIEMVEPSFNQMQVHTAIDLTFAAGIRALMRQDPDIIMVGEIRDLATADMAIQAALTGHLVLSTLHTNDAPTAITRLLELGVPPYLLTSTISGVMAQRLVRTLCPHCKIDGCVEEFAWKELTQPWKAEPPVVVKMPKGCLECRDTGYLGRVGIYEVMPMSQKIQAIINSSGADINKLRAQAYKEGMRSLRLSGAQKVANGVTTIEEVMRVAPAPT
ncbi:MAG: type II secretion system protein E [Gammaproteobacteria bacterium]|nr:MAG: type II secretion system protein E [Gammaproteobacteria bacterium]